MTVGGLLVVLGVAVIVGAFIEAVVGAKPGLGWVGTVVVGAIGAWIGSVLFRVGPVFAGVYLVSAILGATVLILLLKMMVGRSVA